MKQTAPKGYNPPSTFNEYRKSNLDRLSATIKSKKYKVEKENDRFIVISGNNIISHKKSYIVFSKLTGETLLSRHNMKEINSQIAPILNRSDKDLLESSMSSYKFYKQHYKLFLKYKGLEWRGNKKIHGVDILELGAGISPDLSSTHAIDLQKPEYKFPNLDYKYGYDLNRRKLPYINNMFNKVISYGSLGTNFGMQITYNESYRVLKPMGILELGVPSWAMHHNKKDILQSMKTAGFKNITMHKKTMPNSGVLTIIRGVK